MARVDLDELERLAKAAIEASDRLNDENPTRKDADAAYARAVAFMHAAHPSVVLDLIAELRKLRGEVGQQSTGP
jgi:hypothetical protein